MVESFHELGEKFLYCEGEAPLLFTENETNIQRLFGTANRTKYVKDGINNYVVNHQSEAVNPAGTGTKVSPHYEVTINAGSSQTIRLRLTDAGPIGVWTEKGQRGAFGDNFDLVMEARRIEADEFYSTVIPSS